MNRANILKGGQDALLHTGEIREASLVGLRPLRPAFRLAALMLLTTAVVFPQAHSAETRQPKAKVSVKLVGPARVKWGGSYTYKIVVTRNGQTRSWFPEAKWRLIGAPRSVEIQGNPTSVTMTLKTGAVPKDPTTLDFKVQVVARGSFFGKTIRRKRTQRVIISNAADVCKELRAARDKARQKKSGLERTIKNAQEELEALRQPGPVDRSALVPLKTAMETARAQRDGLQQVVANAQSLFTANQQSDRLLHRVRHTIVSQLPVAARVTAARLRINRKGGQRAGDRERMAYAVTILGREARVRNVRQKRQLDDDYREAGEIERGKRASTTFAPALGRVGQMVGLIVTRGAGGAAGPMVKALATAAKQFTRIQNFYRSHQALGSRRAFDRVSVPAPLNARQITSLRRLSAALDAEIARRTPSLNRIRNLMIQMHDIVLDGKINAEYLVMDARNLVRAARQDLRAAQSVFEKAKRAHDVKKAELDRVERVRAGLRTEYRREKRYLEDLIRRSQWDLQTATSDAGWTARRYRDACLKTVVVPRERKKKRSEKKCKGGSLTGAGPECVRRKLDED